MLRGLRRLNSVRCGNQYEFLTPTFHIPAQITRRISKARMICDGSPVSFAFLEAESGKRVDVMSAPGKKLVDVALDNDVEIEAACGGELACLLAMWYWIKSSTTSFLPS